MTCDETATTGVSQTRSRHCEGLMCLTQGGVSYDVDTSDPDYEGLCENH